MSDDMRCVILRGPFTDQDLADIVEIVRRADDRNPTATFNVNFLDAGTGMDDVRRRMEKILPPKEGRTTVIDSIAFRKPTEH